MKKNDILLLIIYIVLTIGMTVYVIQDKINATADQIQVYSDGEVIKSIPLPAADQEFEVKNDLGFIKVAIKEGVVSVIDADCRDQICVHTKAIKLGGEMIVCLPNKMYVEIKKKKNEDNGVDALSQ